jgi:hypothetical protein
MAENLRGVTFFAVLRESLLGRRHSGGDLSNAASELFFACRCRSCTLLPDRRLGMCYASLLFVVMWYIRSEMAIVIVVMVDKLCFEM